MKKKLLLALLMGTLTAHAVDYPYLIFVLTDGSTVAFAFKVPSTASTSLKMVVYTQGTPALSSGVTGSGTSLWGGNGYTSFSGGSSVSLSSYSSGNSGGPGGGGWGR